jgi:antitoxin component HigA of HigAB toxin-antitoxin module
MNMEYLVTSEKHYHESMIVIYELMNKGEENLTFADTEKLKGMTKATEKFEDEALGLSPVKKPNSVSGAIELYMYQNKLSQAKLADELGIGKPKLSQILTGKRKPDVYFLKAIYNKLKLVPKFILDHV